MIWLVCRRRRASLLLVASLTVVVVGTLVTIRGVGAARMRSAGVPVSCFGEVSEGCRAIARTADVAGIGPLWGLTHTLLLVVPLVLGLIAGVGLISRELEGRTLLFVLTQDESRARWCATTLLVGGLPAVVAAAVIGALVGWAFAPLDLVAYPFSPLETPVFETTSVAPVGYTLLAFAVAVSAGVISQNTLTSIVVTVPIYGILMYVLARRLRPHYLPSESATLYDAQNFEAASSRLQNERGWIVDYVPYTGATSGAGRLIHFQPGERYWPFQMIELAILAVLTTLALGTAVRRINSSAGNVG